MHEPRVYILSPRPIIYSHMSDVMFVSDVRCWSSSVVEVILYNVFFCCYNGHDLTGLKMGANDKMCVTEVHPCLLHRRVLG